MRVEIKALQRFYASPLGKAAQRLVQRKLDALWPTAVGLDVLGLGYTTPYLAGLRAGARRVVAMMPAAQGAARWPQEGAGLVCLAEETRLPFMDAVFDRALVVHGLEEAESPRALLREVWRVMAPEGRLVVVAVNRTGFWARSDKTPFGHGRPYARQQLAALLQEAMFAPTARARALYGPPLGWTAKLADPIEAAGAVLWPAFGGLILMEAAKRLYASPPARAVQAEPTLRPRLVGERLAVERALRL